MKILIVDDERQLAEALQEILRRNKYEADVVFDGEAGIDYALAGSYDLLVLDVMLPKRSGLEVIKEIRRQKMHLPVLMLSARSEVADKITGLDLGADDYLTKPFSTDELLARVRALTRRRGEVQGDALECGDLCLDRNTYELSCADSSIKLGLKEFLVLEMLIVNSPRIISKERLIEKVWGYDFEGEYNTVEVYISFLRKKLASVGSQLEIKAVRGVGYCLEVTND